MRNAKARAHAEYQDRYIKALDALTAVKSEVLGYHDPGIPAGETVAPFVNRSESVIRSRVLEEAKKQDLNLNTAEVEKLVGEIRARLSNTKRMTYEED